MSTQELIAQYDVRHANSKDTEAIASLEKFSYVKPYSKQKIKGALTSFGDWNAVVLERKVNPLIIGYALYTFTTLHCQILRMGILPDMRRMGMATYLVDEIIEKYSMPKLNIVFMADKDNYNAHLLFSNLMPNGKSFNVGHANCDCCKGYVGYTYER